MAARISLCIGLVEERGIPTKVYKVVMVHCGQVQCGWPHHDIV